VVTEGGSSYVAPLGNTGVNPSTDTGGYWTLLALAAPRERKLRKDPQGLPDQRVRLDRKARSDQWDRSARPELQVRQG
jgi:hypothetical protein